MPAKSPAQQRFFATVHAIQEGKEAPSGNAGEVAETIAPEKAHDFMHLAKPAAKPLIVSANALLPKSRA
jgi:hypothetical protein